MADDERTDAIPKILANPEEGRALRRAHPLVAVAGVERRREAVDLDLAFLADVSNVLLIRDPRDMLPSLVVQVPSARLADTGLKRGGR